MIHQTKLTDTLNLNKFKHCELKPRTGPIKRFLSIPFLWDTLYICYKCCNYEQKHFRVRKTEKHQKTNLFQMSQLFFKILHTVDIFKKQIKANTTEYDYQKISKIH